MPITQDIHDLFLFEEAVENEVRPRNQFADTGTLGINRTEQWEIFKNRHTVNQRITHAHRGFGVFFGNKFDRCLQVRDGLPGYFMVENRLSVAVLT